jgi:hypothetical protein
VELVAQRRAHHHRAAGDEVAPQEVPEEPLVEHLEDAGIAHGRQLERAVLVDDRHVAPGKAEVGVGIERGGQALQPILRPEVVGAHRREVRAAREVEARRHGRVHAGVLLPDRADRVAVSGDDVGRRVGRAVVDDDQLEVGMRLRQHAVDRLRDVPVVVVRGKDDAHQGGGHAL